MPPCLLPTSIHYVMCCCGRPCSTDERPIGHIAVMLMLPHSTDPSGAFLTSLVFLRLWVHAPSMKKKQELVTYDRHEDGRRMEDLGRWALLTRDCVLRRACIRC